MASRNGISYFLDLGGNFGVRVQAVFDLFNRSNRTAQETTKSLTVNLD